MSDQLVQYSVSRGIARIALDSPRNRNALSAAMVAQLTRGAGHGRPPTTAVRAVELTHTGNTFCAGADLSEASKGGMKDGALRVLALLRDIVALPKPVVGSIDGHVRAGGLGLVGACDIVLAGPKSTFAFSEVRLGLAPAMISLTTIPRLDPRAASRYYLTGESFDAPTAARIGLITEAVEDIDAGTLAVLDALRGCSPQGLRETKPLLTAGILDGFDCQGGGAGRAVRPAVRVGRGQPRGCARSWRKAQPPWAAAVTSEAPGIRRGRGPGSVRHEPQDQQVLLGQHGCLRPRAPPS